MIFAAFVVGYYFEAIMKIITGSYRMEGVDSGSFWYSSGCRGGGNCYYDCLDPDGLNCEQLYHEANVAKCVAKAGSDLSYCKNNCLYKYNNDCTTPPDYVAPG